MRSARLLPIFCCGSIAIAACNTEGGAETPGSSPASTTPRPASSAADEARETPRVPSPTKPLDHTPGVTRWLPAGSECPAPPAEPLVLPPTDHWDGLVTIRDTSDTLYLSPIHTSVSIDGDLVMFGFSRTTGDFALDTFDIAPTFVLHPNIQTDADIVVHAEVHGGPYDDPEDSWFCGGHTFLPDGRLVVVGGTRTAKFATKPGLPQDKRGFGLTYGAIFGEQGWVRIPRDFIGGEAWYPTLVRLSDGRLLMYSGYFELDANLPEVNALLQFNRTMQFFDPKNLVEPWTLVSPSASTPEKTAPANYTWIYELPQPINVGGRDRQLFVMGSEGNTFLMNHVDPFANPSERFVERALREPAVPFANAETSIVALAPYYHAAEANLWRPGSVIAIGGSNDPDLQQQVDFYDPYIDKWCRLTPPLGVVRRNSSYTYLPDGNLLVINGEPVPFDGTAKPQNIPQIIDPRTGRVANGKEEPLDSRRGYHNSAALMPDGRVFVAAGRSARSGSPNLPDERTDGRFYSPYYLGILPPSDRPQIIGIPKDPVMHYGATYEVDYKNGEITGAALVALPANTHATDFNARYVELVVRNGASPGRRGKVKVIGPETAKHAPPGHYMLFLQRRVKGVDVPSVAQIVRVDGDTPLCDGLPINACGGCRPLPTLPGTECWDVCGVGTLKCDGPNKTSCNACL